MSTRIYFFTGTGNSLWAARTLAQSLGAPEPTPMVRALRDDDLRPAEEQVGLVFPVYMYRMPHIVVDFVKKLETKAPVFVVATCGGDAGDMLLQTRRVFQGRGLDLAQGFTLPVQSNYIPFGGAPEAPILKERLATSESRLADIAARIKQGERTVETSHSLMRTLVHPGLLYRLGYKFISVSDKSYVVDDTCNACGLCARVCPVDNIEMVQDRPHWKNQCQQCMACMQWCPTEAVQVKDKTRGLRRYHHPEIKAKDLLAQKR